MAEDNKKRQDNGNKESIELFIEHSEQRMYNLTPNPNGVASGFSPDYLDQITTPNTPTFPVKDTESE